VRIARLELGKLRAVANHHLPAGKVEAEKGLDVFLDRDAARIQKHRTIAEQPRVARAEQLRVDATGPGQDPVEAALAEIGSQAFGRDHHAGARRVKVPLCRVDPSFGNRPAGAHVVRKARVEARGERKLAATAVGAGHPTDGPFGCDVDGFGARFIDEGRAALAIRNGEADLGVAGTRYAAEVLRAEHDQL